MNTEHLNSMANISIFGIDLAIIGVIALMTIMTTTGLTLSIQDFRPALKSPKAIYFGLFSQLIALPTVAFLLVQVFEPASYIAISLIILSCCPGGATSNFFTLLAKGDVAVSIFLTVLSGVVTVFSIPLIVNFALDSYMEVASSITLPIIDSMLRIFILVVLPVFIGMGVNHRYPVLSKKMEPMATMISFVLVLVTMFVVLQHVWKGLLDLIVEAGLITLSLNIFMMAFAFIGGRILLLDEKELRCITIEVGVQNYLLSVVIALSMLEQPLFSIVPLLYLFVMYITVFSFILYARFFREKLLVALASKN